MAGSGLAGAHDEQVREKSGVATLTPPTTGTTAATKKVTVSSVGVVVMLC